MDIATLKAECLKLELDDRVLLAHDLWASVEAAADLPLSDELKAELGRRLEDCRRRPDDVVSWESVKGRLLSRL